MLISQIGTQKPQCPYIARFFFGTLKRGNHEVTSV
jgi:hypothetical protein